MCLNRHIFWLLLFGKKKKHCTLTPDSRLFLIKMHDLCSMDSPMNILQNFSWWHLQEPLTFFLLLWESHFNIHKSRLHSSCAPERCHSWFKVDFPFKWLLALIVARTHTQTDTHSREPGGEGGGGGGGGGAGQSWQTDVPSYHIPPSMPCGTPAF